jgi:hypothetical protein
MFGNFKRDALLRALNKYIKGIHPQLQAMQLSEKVMRTGEGSKAQYVVCLEGIKKKDDLTAFFMLPIDPASPTIIEDIQAQFYKDDLFMFRDLAEAIHDISTQWKSHLKTKSGMTFRMTTTGFMCEPYVPYGFRKGWYNKDKVTMCISVASPAGVVNDHFWLTVTVPDQDRNLKVQSWCGSWTPPIDIKQDQGVAEHGRLFARFIKSAEESKANRLIQCEDLVQVLKKADEATLAQYLLMNASTFRALRRRF